eukprot:TRINITY_DN64188_c0_g1_i1.p1 TRINITY_DN64188_c0_g1~~TRINITY_DN64188_c0_g1_i1.p1  ORF type:complete len:630 (-),score=121.51 TRINITY_DN64188_c0_g1_i1:19-1908(-)
MDDEESGRFDKGLQRGRYLHETVPPTRWSVTKEDLLFLESEVQQEIVKGQIRPCRLDLFDPGDLDIGPNAYTVVQQYIKRVTRKAGGMSWALMRHNQGLDCDLFVTHAWCEGIFEFIEKVLASWPWGARHAWVCFLANPQNLDIGQLISVPSKSPFSLALRQSEYMLVIPNSSVSIYSRIWCCYEAYLALEGEKIILEGRRSIMKRYIEDDAPTLVLLFLMGLVAACLLILTDGKERFLCDYDEFQWDRFYDVGNVRSFAQRGNLVLLIGFFLCWFLSDRVYGLKDVVVFGGVLWSGFLITAVMLYLLMGGSTYKCATVMSKTYTWSWKHLALAVLELSFFVLVNYDRVSDDIAATEASLLTAGFAGDVRGATASSQSDKEAIMEEIGDRASDVNQCVEVLIHAHMSTNDLRIASRHRVGVTNAGLYRLAALYCGFGAWCAITLTIAWLVDDPVEYVLGFVPIACWVVVFYACKTAEKRAFATRAMTKIVVYPVILLLVFQPTFWQQQVRFRDGFVPIHGFNGAGRLSDSMGLLLPFATLLKGLGATAVVVSYLNIGKLVVIPHIGPSLVGLILQSAMVHSYELRPAALRARALAVATVGRATSRATQLVPPLRLPAAVSASYRTFSEA